MAAAKRSNPPQGLFDSHIPSLDGLRAAAVLWVIVSHTLMGNRIHPYQVYLRNRVGTGWLGVETFFVISGFLITGLLLREHRRTGRVDLKAFFIRRALRILPAFFALILAVLGMRAAGLIRIGNPGILAAIFFCTNYNMTLMSWPLVHTWSLSIEEQFYLVWPWVFKLLRPRGALLAAVALLAASPLLRIHLILDDPESMSWIGTAIHTHADMLMCGCALALLWDDRRFGRICGALLRLRLPLAALAYLVLFSSEAAAQWGGRFGYYLGYTINSLLIGLVLVWVIREPGSWVGRALNSRPMVHIGAMSYSLYLWQQLFTDPQNNIAIERLPWNWLLILVFAEASRQLIEKPALRWRGRYAR